MVSAGHVGRTRGSGIVSSAADVLWMSVMRGMRGVGGVCEMCMCLTRSGVGGEGVSGCEDWVLPILWEQGEGVLDVCLCLGCSVVGGVGGESVGAWTRLWRGMGGVMSV